MNKKIEFLKFIDLESELSNISDRDNNRSINHILKIVRLVTWPDNMNSTFRNVFERIQ